MSSCIILAGGESSRMGKDKRFLKVDGEYFLSRVVEKAREFADHIIISLGQGGMVEKAADIAGASIVTDKTRGIGPIMGILAGLKNCEEEYCAIVPCDSPFIEPEIFKFMFSVSKGYDAVVPSIKTDKIEPLHAIYRVSPMIQACERVLEDGRRGVKEAIEELESVNYVPVRDLKRYDKELLTFLNANRPEDLKKIEEAYK